MDRACFGRMLGTAAVVAVAAATLAGAPGCASTRGGEFRPAMLTGTDSVIYVMRPRGFGTGAWTVVVNQQPVGELRSGEYLAFVAPPGEYLVRVEGASSVVRRVRLIENDSAFLEARRDGLADFPNLNELPTTDGMEAVGRLREAPLNPVAGRTT